MTRNESEDICPISQDKMRIKPQFVGKLTITHH